MSAVLRRGAARASRRPVAVIWLLLVVCVAALALMHGRLASLLHERDPFAARCVPGPAASGSGAVDAEDGCAYSMYATTSAHLCGALLTFRRLKQLGASSAAANVVLTTAYTDNDPLRDALRREGARVIQVRELETHADDTFSKGATKLHAFNMTQYRRVVFLDGDGLVMRPLRHLCALGPEVPAAFATAYWGPADEPAKLSGALFSVAPDSGRFERLLAAVRAAGHESEMDLLQREFGPQAALLPASHCLLTGTVRAADVGGYYGGSRGRAGEGEGRRGAGLDPREVVRGAYYVHFSDWPLRKPFQLRGVADVVEWLEGKEGGRGDPKEAWNKAWLGLYETYLAEMQACRDAAG
ncbi:unnamed protein product [Pedinophyceae sp. YPF-701]|nr:unnamed protein product [Pedinophyceae sp. YPF-701]